MLPNSSKIKRTNHDPKGYSLKLVRGAKPLVNFNFFLDISNYRVNSKVEEKIKELGGKIELFLERHVTHVISERQNLTEGEKSKTINTGGRSVKDLNSTPLAISNDSNSSFVESPFTPDVASTALVKRKTRNRTEAMLDKVANQSTRNTFDVLDNAKSWGIPIWSVNKILQWLEKVANNIEIKNLNKNDSKASGNSEIKFLISPFIKFEPFTRDRRPVYKEFSSWPTINFDFKSGESPFVFDKKKSSNHKTKNTKPIVKTNSTKKDIHFQETVIASPKKKNKTPQVDKKIMLRKRSSLRSSVKIDEIPQIKSGFCEICKIEYENLSIHIESESHLIFTRDDSNFFSLDKLIKEEANVETFLSLAGANRNISTTYLATPRRSLRTTPLDCNSIELKLIDSSSFINKSFEKNSKVKSPCNDNHKSTNNDNSNNSEGRQLRSKRNRFGSLSPRQSEDANNKRKQIELVNTMKDKRNGSNGNVKKNGECSKQLNNSDNLAELDDDSMFLRTRSCKNNGKITSPKSNCKKGENLTDDETVNKSNSNQTRIKTPIGKPELNGKSKVYDSDTSTEDEEPLIKHVQNNVGEKKLDKADKRKSADIKLVHDNKSYYKVEVLNSKLRSNNCNRNQALPEEESNNVKDDHEKNHNNNENGDRLVVKFKRIRMSELSVLNNEAENFMFPKREDPVDDSSSSTDIEPNSTLSSQPGNTSDIKSSSPMKDALVKQNFNHKNELIDEGSQSASSSNYGSDTASNEERKRKRRTQAEAFILDNEKYYKFETPGSRLRYQGNYYPIIPNNSEAHKEKIKVKKEPNPDGFSVDNFTYPFENFTVNSKQDVLNHFKRNFDCFASYYCRPDFYMLPYQQKFNVRPVPLDPKLCIDKLKNSTENEPNQLEKTPKIELPNEGLPPLSIEIEEPIEPISVPVVEPEESKGEKERKIASMKKLIRKKLLLSPKSPRKSPRKHASTLAILSSLINKRRSREKHNQSPVSSASPVSEHKPKISPKKEPTVDKQVLEEYFNNNWDLPELMQNCPLIDDDSPSALNQEVQSDVKPNLCDLLSAPSEFDFDVNSLVSKAPVEIVKIVKEPKKVFIDAVPILIQPIRRRSKLKVNKTGWPKVKKKRIIREESGYIPKKTGPKTDKPLNKKKKFSFKNSPVLPKKKIIQARKRLSRNSKSPNKSPRGAIKDVADCSDQSASSARKSCFQKKRISPRQQALSSKYTVVSHVNLFGEKVTTKRKKPLGRPKKILRQTTLDKFTSPSPKKLSELLPLVKLQKLDEGLSVNTSSPYSTRKRKLTCMAESPIDDDLFPRPHKRHKRNNMALKKKVKQKTKS